MWEAPLTGCLITQSVTILRKQRIWTISNKEIECIVWSHFLLGLYSSSVSNFWDFSQGCMFLKFIYFKQIYLFIISDHQYYKNKNKNKILQQYSIILQKHSIISQSLHQFKVFFFMFSSLFSSYFKWVLSSHYLLLLCWCAWLVLRIDQRSL